VDGVAHGARTLETVFEKQRLYAAPIGDQAKRSTKVDAQRALRREKFSARSLSTAFAPFVHRISTPRSDLDPIAAAHYA